jgi:phosphatidate cytidylyltransferase
MLRHRVQSGLLLGGAVVAAAIWLPTTGIFGILLALGGLATWEFYSMLKAGSIPAFGMFGVGTGLALMLVSWVTLQRTGGACDGGEWLVLLAAVFLMFVRQFPQKFNDRPIETMAATLFGIMYVPFLFNFFSKILYSPSPSDGRMILLYMIIVVKFTDIGAYFVGCAIGRHKMFPRISPAKSWEGCIGGLVTGTAASLVYLYIAKGGVGDLQVSLWHGLALGLLLGVAGILGDLAESMVKRAVGVKDSGSYIQGMGGVMDLLDSLLFAAPVLYVYARWLL